LKKGLDEITTLKAEAMLELQPSVDSSDLIVEHVNIRCLRKLRRNSSLFNIKVINFLFLYIFSQLCLRNLRKGHKMIKFNNQNSEYWNVFHRRKMTRQLREIFRLMSELCYVFLSLMWRTLHLPNWKIAQIRRVFLEELM